MFDIQEYATMAIQWYNENKEVIIANKYEINWRHPEEWWSFGGEVIDGYSAVVLVVFYECSYSDVNDLNLVWGVYAEVDGSDDYLEINTNPIETLSEMTIVQKTSNALISRYADIIQETINKKDYYGKAA